LAAESNLVKACLQLLALRGVPAWRTNSGGLSVERAGRRHFYKFNGAKGCSDILGLLPPGGRMLAVECKLPGNRPTPDQQAFLAAIASAGGIALVITDIAQLDIALKEFPP
jgi:hypothetical protein